MRIERKDKKKDIVKVVPGFEPGLPEGLREVKIWSDNHYLHWRLDRLQENRVGGNVHYTTVLLVFDDKNIRN